MHLRTDICGSFMAKSEGCRAGVHRPKGGGEGGRNNKRCETSGVVPHTRGYAGTRRLGMPTVGYTYVYVLSSVSDPSRHYVGCTDNMKSRLISHNTGGNRHTAKYRPWQIEACIAFRDTEKARAFERYLKSGSGREFARRHF
jgi:putative endonuclease